MHARASVLRFGGWSHVQHLYAVSIGGSCLPSQSFRLSFPHLLPRVCERSNLSEEIAIPYEFDIGVRARRRAGPRATDAGYPAWEQTPRKTSREVDVMTHERLNSARHGDTRDTMRLKQCNSLCYQRTTSKRALFDLISRFARFICGRLVETREFRIRKSSMINEQQCISREQCIIAFTSTKHVSIARRIARKIETFIATRYKLFVQITDARYSYARIHHGISPISRSVQGTSGIGNKASEINVHLSASTPTWLSRAMHSRNVDIVRRDEPGIISSS